MFRLGVSDHDMIPTDAALAAPGTLAALLRDSPIAWGSHAWRLSAT